MTRPDADPPLTVRQEPGTAVDDPAARRAIRADRGPLPWLVVTGAGVGEPLSHDDVDAWPIAHPAGWSPQLRRDLDHLRTLTRKELVP